MKVKVAQLCLTLCDPMDYIVHGILQARIPEWVAYPFSSRSSTPRNQTRVSCIASGFFTNWPISKIITVLLYCRIISVYCLVVFHFSVEIWFYLFSVNHSDYFQHKMTKEKDTDSLSAEDSESLGETADVLNMVLVFLFVQYRYKFEF